MARDPLGLADQDIDQITLTLRERRGSWLTDEAKGKRTATKAAAEKKPFDPNMSLEDLGL